MHQDDPAPLAAMTDRRESDRWKTGPAMLFILTASLLLWALITLKIGLML